MTAVALPATVDIGPYRYQIVTEQLAILLAGEEAQSKLLGEADHAKLTITLDIRPAPGIVRETLVHELCHVIAIMAGFSTEWGKDREEEIVQRFSPWLLELLRRNPDVVAFILDDE